MTKLLLKLSICQEYGHSLSEYARSPPKILGHGGGPMFWWGGTKDFPDGGGQVSMGGDKVMMGGVPPPIAANPEYLGNRLYRAVLADSWLSLCH